ncbi:DUF4846 domain-containing protein [Hymenobacter sp. B81]|uniref:DUF4846 domain-containing protein n=1 Tax=Hymenobacter sp. B81 TaxID=3344878 RepID=UPI0037DD8A51
MLLAPPQPAPAQNSPATSQASLATNAYPWLTTPYRTPASLAARFAPPAGCRRVALPAGSFGHWLRFLPLKPAGTAVRLHTGKLKPLQTVHAAVVDIDTGPRDLQQCADAVIRLRGEYLFSQDFRRIHFQLTSGHTVGFADWVAGQTFQVRGEEVLPARKPAEAPTHAALRRYLDLIFTYAGTLSLARELRPAALASIQPGDVLIKGGSPGHAVLVLDAAEHAATRRRYVLLAQSYMPAQDLHVLRNVEQPQLGAWFAIDPAAEWLETPEWSFSSDQLKRWP